MRQALLQTLTEQRVQVRLPEFRQKLCGREQRALRGAQARQRLGLQNRSGLQLHDRLDEHLQPAAVEQGADLRHLAGIDRVPAALRGARHLIPAVLQRQPPRAHPGRGELVRVRSKEHQHRVDRPVPMHRQRHRAADGELAHQRLPWRGARLALERHSLLLAVGHPGVGDQTPAADVARIEHRIEIADAVRFDERGALRAGGTLDDEAVVSIGPADDGGAYSG